MQAHWSEATVGEHGELLLRGLPFDAGEPVDVFVISKGAKPGPTGSTLRDSVLAYQDPLDPVAGDDWDTLR